MNNSDLYVLEEAIKFVENKIIRDYSELEHLQNSNKTIDFTNASVSFLQQKLYDFFRKRREHFSLVVKDFKSEIVENSEATIYVNCMIGIKNFSHAIPYFATVLSIRRNGKVVAAVVNNYAENQMFNCAKSGGCFVNTRRIRVSNRNSLGNSLVAVKYGNNKQNIEKITKNLSMFNINNCSVLDFCNTAAGKYDGCVIMDSAKEELEIGELFVQESGGLFYYLNKEKTSCIFSNSLILDGLKKIFS